MDRVTDDILKEGIANTENEIFNEATGKDAPSTEGGPGDRSVEEMGTGHEGQLEADEVEGGDEGEGGAKVGDSEGEGQGDQKAEKEGEQPRDQKTGQFAEKPAETPAKAEADDKPVDPKARVPLSELITERKARQALQTQLETERTTSRSQFDQLNARIDQLVANQKPAQPQPDQTQPAKKEFWDDPDGFVANLSTDLEQKFNRKFVNADLQRTHRLEGDKFMTAYTELTTRGKTDPAVAAEMIRINQSATPGLDIMAWHQKQEAERAIGGDPAKFVEKTRQEMRDELAKDPEFLRSLGLQPAAPDQGGRQQQAPQGDQSPRHVTRLPKSLNGASGGQSGARQASEGQQIDGSDRGVFEFAFTD